MKYQLSVYSVVHVKMSIRTYPSPDYCPETASYQKSENSSFTVKCGKEKKQLLNHFNMLDPENLGLKVDLNIYNP